ncbi:MAG: FlgD immunoglobulin-like domain containing protein, partial [Candidatus Neomarinimicrobiota bacterium]
NYPNPFNPTTTIKYDLPKDVHVKIVIYDIMGREVRTLVNARQQAGYKSIQWNATNNHGMQVSSGYYIYIMQAGEFHKNQKMILMK